MWVIGHEAPTAACNHRRWLRSVRAAAELDLLAGVRLEHLGEVERRVADDHAALRAYLDRWRWEAGEFFEREQSRPAA